MDAQDMTGPSLAPLAESDPAAHEPFLDELVATLGYRPNALLTMARQPGLLPAILSLVRVAVWSEGALAIPLRLLLACEASRGAGCGYTAAHVVHAAHHAGIGWDKLAALPFYAGSPLFSQRERGALLLATAGGTLPVRGTDAAFARARQILTEAEMIEAVAVIASFGWFNRWNSLVGTTLEQVPTEALAHVPWLAALQNQKVED